MALVTERETRLRDGYLYVLDVAAGVTLYQGAIGCANATGYATPGATSTTLTALGRVEGTVTGGATDGASRVQIRRGCFLFKNSATDAVDRTSIGKPCYVVDDETVAKTNGTNTRSQAGIVHDVESNGVWVRF
jgi:hypothetical protein